ncbi:hypothetical protein APV28_5054 [Comamonas testosteroni]|nr:hypothetical protein APV28_5054 [Comamonas testosteroni]
MRHPLQQTTAFGRERKAGEFFGWHGAYRVVQALCCIAIDSGAKGDTGMGALRCLCLEDRLR